MNSLSPEKHDRKAYALGVGLILLGGVALSTGGVMVRYIQDAEAWTILFYRSLGFLVFMGGFILFRYGRRTPGAFRAIGVNGLVMSLSLGVGFSCYVFAMTLTTVANVSFIISAGPLFAAVLGWFILREKVSSLTWMVIAGAAVGMGMMFADGIVGGRLAGTIIALGLPITFALMIVLIRRAGEIDMLPATFLAGTVGLVAGFFIADTISVTMHDLLLMLCLGAAQLGLGFMLITIGTRYVPAAEAALLALSESVLAPIWAWLFVAEVPAPLAMGGGLLVLSCVAIQAIAGVQRERRLRQSE